MKIVIVGAGAMGSLFAGHLGMNEDNEVWAYDVWQEHVNAIKANGLVMVKNGVNNIVKINATSDPSTIGKCDLIIVLTKYIHTEKAMNDVKNIIDENTKIITLQNGIGNVDILLKYVDENQILFGLTTLPSELIGPGHIEVSGTGVTYAWPYNNELTDEILKIEKNFRESDLDFMMNKDIHHKIWSKLMVNCSVAVVCAINQAKVGDLIDNGFAVKLIENIVKEITTVANAKGIDIDYEKSIEDVMKVAREGYEHYPSIAVDIIKNRKTEIDCLNGAVIKEGLKNKIDVPFNESVYLMIKTIEETSNQGGKLWIKNNS